MFSQSIVSIKKVVFNNIYQDKNSMGEKDHPIVTNMLQHLKVSLFY